MRVNGCDVSGHVLLDGDPAERGEAIARARDAIAAGQTVRVGDHDDADDLLDFLGLGGTRPRREPVTGAYVVRVARPRVRAVQA